MSARRDILRKRNFVYSFTFKTGMLRYICWKKVRIVRTTII